MYRYNQYRRDLTKKYICCNVCNSLNISVYNFVLTNQLQNNFKQKDLPKVNYLSNFIICSKYEIIFFYVATSVLLKSECVYFSTVQRMFQTDWQKTNKKTTNNNPR